MPSLKAFAKDAKRKVESVEPQKKKTVRKGVVLSNLSTEKITSSDSEEEEESEEDSSSDEGSAPKKVIVSTPKINGKVATKAPLAAVKDDSDDSSSDSSSDDEAPPPKPKAAVSKTNGKAITDSSDSSSSSDSGSSDERRVGESDEESTSESSEEDSSGSEASVVKAKQPASLSKPARQKSSESKTVAFSDLEPFIPPSGFRLQSIKEVTQASELFSKSNLKGKQIWHITAPASVSMEAIKAMSWPDIVQQNAVISHNGNKYGFVQVSNQSTASTKIMVPNSSSDGYHATSKPISATLHLQQIVDLPVDTTDQSSSARATIPAKKPVRQQPKGLKMRFRPLGFGEGDMGKIGYSSSSSDSESDSDEDMLDTVVKFKKPPFISPGPAIMSSKAKGSDTDSSSSASDSGSDSDVEMPDVSAPGAKQSTAAKSTTILPPKSGGIKRKHTDDIEDSEKTSSSKSKSTTNGTVLNSVKKAKADQQLKPNKPLASIETQRIRVESPIPHPKRAKPGEPKLSQQPSVHRESPIPPPKSILKKTPSFVRSESSSSVILPPVRQSPIPPPLSTSTIRPPTKESPAPPSSSVARSVKDSPIPAPERPRQSAIIPPQRPERKSNSVTPISSKKRTVNQIEPANEGSSAAKQNGGSAVRSTPILPPKLMSSQLSSSMPTPTPKQRKPKLGK